MSSIQVPLNEIKAFWVDEEISSAVYSFMSHKISGNKASLFKEIAHMEANHANMWNDDIAKEIYNAQFKKGFILRFKIFLMKLLALIMPLSFIIYYLELNERIGFINYTEALEKYKDNKKIFTVLESIISQEITHEASFIDLLLGEESHLKRVKDAIYGMTDSLVEILALVIGLAGVFQGQPLIVGLAGLISAIGGTFSMTSGAYLSAKSQTDIYKGKVKEIDLKEGIGGNYLNDGLKKALVDKDIKPTVAEKIISLISTDAEVIKTLYKRLDIEESPEDAKGSALTTGFYYILGALPALIPFFVAPLFHLNSVIAAIIAISLAAVVSFMAGIYTSVLSGISLKTTPISNVLIIIGSAIITYFIGSVARTVLGIQI